MVDGFSAACRRLAVDAGRDSWRELAELRVLTGGLERPPLVTGA